MATNKVAIITGGGTGIGRAAALALQADGWDVVVAGRRKDELDKAVKQLKQKPQDEATKAEIDELLRERDKFLELIKEINARDLLGTLTDYGLTPRARIHHLSVRGDDPVMMLSAPIPATAYALDKTGLSIDDIDVVEINRAEMFVGDFHDKLRLGKILHQLFRVGKGIVFVRHEEIDGFLAA